eukprot:TRINITY_DN29663_c0_g1_i1.p1 TRINITY_DN29663_c0_g1~~TRINITY_DN29663_c0_g1_i1.p1  ORF type:complete len:520 (-),score=48.65 TRINITY_DN29663_c0_g1_i1:150-1709(-)
MAEYQLPPDGIAALVDSPVTPSFSLDPTRRWGLLISQPSAPPIEEIAREECKLAGTRLDPALWTPSHLSFGHDPTLRQLISDDGDTPIPVGTLRDVPIEGLPVGHGVRYTSWRPSGGALAFVVRPEKASEQLELWWAVLDTSGDQPRCMASQVPLGGRTLQSVHGRPHQWTPDGRLMVKLVPSGHPSAPPTKPLRPSGPAVQEVDGSSKKPARTYQDLLKDQHDEDTFSYFTAAELVLLELDGAHWGAPRTVGPPEGALLVKFQPSPDNSCVLASVLDPDEYSYQVPLSRFGRSLEIWPMPGDLGGASCRTVLRRIPVQDSVPKGFDARPTGPRQPSWHPCHPATLIWVEAVDQGDPEGPASPEGFRDVLITRSAPWAEPKEKVIFGMATKWAGWWFTEHGVGLIKERRWKDRHEVAWRLDADLTRTKLWERCSQESYSDPGYPEEVTNARRQWVLQCASPGTAEPVVYFMGDGASPNGDRPFVDCRPLAPGAEVTRVWRCAAGPHTCLLYTSPSPRDS